MPRVVDYPHGSFKSALEIAAAIDYLGGSCTVISCAERLGKKVSGGFKALISSAIKHGLIISKKETLNTTEVYRIYKLSYNDQEKLNTLQKAFLHPPLYQKIYERFKGKELPIAMLDKLLMREFNVEELYGSRVAGYFVDGAKSLQMLENGRLLDSLNINDNDKDNDQDPIENETYAKDISYQSPSTREAEPTKPSIVIDSNIFTIMIAGPGINTKIQIEGEEDLVIMEAMLNKIRKKVKEGS